MFFLLISPDVEFIRKVSQSMGKLIQKMPRADIIRQSLEGRGALIQVNDMDDAIKIKLRQSLYHLKVIDHIKKLP